MGLEPFERFAHPGVVAISLGFAPSVARIAVHVVEAE